MVAQNQLLDMTAVGMRFTVLKNSAATAGRALELHWEVLPGCNLHDPLVHIHPHAIETYEVLEGEMEFFVRDKWTAARAGDKLTVPQGVKHTFRNSSAQIATVFNTHQPALKMENYFADVCKVLAKLTDNGTKVFRMNLRAMLYMGVLMNRYRDDIVATSPPDLAIRILGLLGNAVGVAY